MAAQHTNRRSYKPTVRIQLRVVLPILVLVAVLYVLIPRFGSFRSSWTVLRAADVPLVMAATTAVIGTNVAAAFVYWRLVRRPIAFGPMLLVQIASSFTNRLLPAGTGAMATSAAYLVKRGHTAAQAGSVAILNNTLGFVGNICLLGLVLSLSPGLVGVRLPVISPWVGAVILVVATGALVGIMWWPRMRRLVREGLYELRRVFRRPGHVLSALLGSMVVTGCFALALYLSSRAVGVHLTLLQAIYVLTAGVAVGAVTPVPGGLGGVEAGSVAAMVSVGIPAAPAFAATLLYRLVSYWLPIIPGYLCFQIALKKRYI